MTSAAPPRAVFTTRGGSPRFFMSDDGGGRGLPADRGGRRGCFRFLFVFAAETLVTALSRCSPP